MNQLNQLIDEKKEHSFTERFKIGLEKKDIELHYINNKKSKEIELIKIDNEQKLTEKKLKKFKIYGTK